MTLPRPNSSIAGQSGRESPGEPSPAGSPWQYARQVSASATGPDQVRLTRRSGRYDLAATLWTVSQVERIRACRRRVHGGEVTIKNNAGVAHFAGLETCGSIWACPVCSGCIRNTRALLISQGAGNWIRGGGSVWMVTLTAPHNLGMRLKALLPVIAQSFTSVIAGRPWLSLKERCGIVGTIRSMEVTHGEHGWHPHLHVLVFARGDLDDALQSALSRHFREKWQRAITAAGYAMPSDQHGVVVERCIRAEEAGLYIAKAQDSGVAVGNELARGDLKGGRHKGRTPFQILADYRAHLMATGDRTPTGDLALWNEYETVTRGHQCITWSKGLRALLDVDEDQELSDEELAAAEVGGDDVITIDRDTWRSVTYVPGLPARLLEAAERGGRLGVLAVLRRHGLDADADPRSFTAGPVAGSAPWRQRVADADWSHGR